MAMAVSHSRNHSHFGLVVLVGGAALFDLKLLAFFSLLAAPRTGVRYSSLGSMELARHYSFRLTYVYCSRHRDGKQPGVPSQTVVAGGIGPHALVFHKRLFPTLGACDRGVPLPRSAKIHAVVSLSLWAGVITCGRLLAYL
jgi:hypothetical protein